MDKDNATVMNKREQRGYIILLGRILLAVALLILAYTADMPKVSVICILVAAAFIGGFNTLFSLVDAVIKKEFFNTICLAVLAAVAVFCTGCFKEAVLFIIFFEICSAAFDYVQKRTLRSVADFIDDDNVSAKEAVKAAVSHPDANRSALKDRVQPLFDLAVRAALVIGVLFALLAPLISDMTFIMSIRRGAMLIAAVASTAALGSLTVCTAYGIAVSAGYGVYVKDSETLEKAADIRTVVYDKTDVFSDGVPTISAVYSSALDKDTFLQLAAYIACRSEQRIAAQIVNAYGGELKPKFIDEFKDIPGCGMEITVKGHQMYLGTKELLDARGVEIPEADIRPGYVLYMVIGNGLAGSLTFKENLSPYAEAVVSDFAKLGGIKSVLFTEDGREISEKLAISLNVDDLHYECDSAKKLSLLGEIKDNMSDGDVLMYVSAENVGFHTPADIDAKVGFVEEDADMFLSTVGLFGLPVVYSAAQKAKQISRQNLLAAVVVKLLLIILAFTGAATMWFVILLDFAVSIACLFNVTRILTIPAEKTDKQAD